MNARPSTLDTQPPDWDPVSLDVFGCWGTNAGARLIMRVAGGGPHHVGLKWSFASDQVERAARKSGALRMPMQWYMEALFGRKIGPARPWSHVEKWAAEKPGRRVECIRLPLDPRAVARTWLTAQTCIGAVSYAEWQLLGMYLHERLHFPVPASLGRMVCSEFDARVVYPEIDLRSEYRDFDEVTPRSLWAVASSLNTETRNLKPSS